MYSFNKNSRLKTKEDYNSVFKQPKRITTHEFTFLYRYNTIGYARLGLIIPKKRVRKAHDRNYVKRVLRESFRVHTDIPSVDVVILARNRVDKKNKDQWIITIGHVWEKLLTLKVS